MKSHRWFTALLLMLALVFGTAACSSDADVVSHNLSQEADKFRVMRRVVFFNGFTDKYLLVIEGRCSLGNNDDPGELTVTCKVGEGEGAKGYKKHFLGLSDNVSYFVEQLEAAEVDAYHYKVMFRPEEIVPDIDLDTSGDPDE